MRKNDLVRFTKEAHAFHSAGQRYGSRYTVDGFRSLSGDERELWYKKHTEAVKAGRTTWHDSAGEPKLAPTTCSLSFPVDGHFIVLKARTTANRGYRRVGGLAKIACPSTGQVGYVKRQLLEKVSK